MGTPPGKEKLMTNDLMDYEALVRDAYRVIVRKVLTRVAKTGLPGDHHFYVAFDTTAPGVSIPDFLSERFPEEMTVVLQHDFWGLEVDEDGFEVHLHFDGRPSQLIIPFDALTGFLDPSVQFGVKFQADDEIEFPDSDFSGESVPGLVPERDLDSSDEPEDTGDKEKKTGEVIALSKFRKD
jgi:hypothetical protein